MNASGYHCVTGAYGYSGRYIAEKLLARGHRVITLTNSPARPNAFAGDVAAYPLRFDDVNALAESLRDVEVLYNTYWVRFNHALFQHADAVNNTLALFDAAKRAGVRRVVHVSITNPTEESPLEYFHGKARLERALRESGIAHTILRPAVLFGGDDILINNIAWALRRLPVFGVFGRGDYRIQPIHVDDFAQLAVEGGEDSGNRIVEAIGPETYTYRALVETIADSIGVSRPIVSVPPWLGLATGQIISRWQNDVFITREEIRGLMDDLLYVDAPPAGTTRLSDWAREHGDTLGRRYASELARRRNRSAAYAEA
ncbi:MAG: NAD(P)H-binding protein [Candidatus Hydrogenedens sp.]|nr:NAD(P)H-binding protein [Candidatus Hydrogenedens sp.]